MRSSARGARLRAWASRSPSRELDELSRAFGAYLQGKGLKQGRSRRPDDAEHPAIPGVPVRHPARRLHGRQRQSALHRARARASIDRQRRRDHRRRREFRAHGRRSRGEDASEAGDRDQHRRNARTQGAAGRLRAAPRQEDDSGVEPAGRDPPVRGAGRRRTRNARTRFARPRRHRVPAIHRRHDRRRQRRDAAAPEHRRQPAAVAGLGEALPRRRAASHHHAAAAVSHLLADRELPGVHDAGRRERAHPESARHSRIRQGNGQAPVHRVHRRQHAVQRAAEQC